MDYSDKYIKIINEQLIETENKLELIFITDDFNSDLELKLIVVKESADGLETIGSYFFYFAGYIDYYSKVICNHSCAINWSYKNGRYKYCFNINNRRIIVESNFKVKIWENPVIEK